MRQRPDRVQHPSATLVTHRHRRRAALLLTVATALASGVAWGADDPRDATFLEPMLQRTLEVTRANVEVPWRNPATGNRGKIVVERTFYRDPQTPCRAFMRTLERPGAPPEITRGTGCRAGTGLWLIEKEPEIAAVEPSAPAGTSRPDPAEEERAPAVTLGPDPTCPDTVMVPMPTTRPPALAFTMPAKAEL